ncbi:uncharacterized protein [Clytia hemisphaerica]|uniref:Uncharacterized protein n=1 Tax=Clytia hemisphaerica TaxID=252671 RepID=A0A7M5XF18_9CNID|eukprot:TCONS_00061957-protein
MDVNFVWENKDKDVTDINKVELLLAKAQSIFSDPFSDYEKAEEGNLLKRKVMRKASESNADLYALTVHNLPIGVYHYMFLVRTAEKEWLSISTIQKITMLGPRRKVNYIELDPTTPKSIISFSECIDENTPLMNPPTAIKNASPSSEQPRRSFACLCCTR